MTTTIIRHIIAVLNLTNNKIDTKGRRIMCIYGYCRISTKQQSIERQIRNIKTEYNTAVIVTEAYSGTTLNRPECKILSYLIQCLE